MSPRICTDVGARHRASRDTPRRRPRQAIAPRRAARGAPRAALRPPRPACRDRPAPARVEHDGIADLPRAAPLAGITGRLLRGHHRRSPARSPARARITPSLVHDHGRRSPEASPAGAGLGERRVLRQKAVAGMHGVRRGLARDADDVLDTRTGLDRTLAFADQVALVRLHPVQREPVFRRVHRTPCVSPARSRRASRGWRSRRGWR